MMQTKMRMASMPLFACAASLMLLLCPPRSASAQRGGAHGGHSGFAGSVSGGTHFSPSSSFHGSGGSFRPSTSFHGSIGGGIVRPSSSFSGSIGGRYYHSGSFY